MQLLIRGVKGVAGHVQAPWSREGDGFAQEAYFEIHLVRKEAIRIRPDYFRKGLVTLSGIAEAHQRMKIARWLMNLTSATVRRPLRPLAPAKVARIRTQLEQIGFNVLPAE